MSLKIILPGLAKVLVIIMSICTAPASGQVQIPELLKRSPETRAHIITTIIERKLSLDSDQTDRVYDINLKYARGFQEYMNKDSISPEMHEELIEKNEMRKDELLALLTEEQIKTAYTIRDLWIDRLELVLEKLKENDLNNH